MIAQQPYQAVAKCSCTDGCRDSDCSWSCNYGCVIPGVSSQDAAAAGRQTVQVTTQGATYLMVPSAIA